MSEDKFKTRLKIAKNKAKIHKDQETAQSGSNMGTAFKMSTELVSAVAVGTIIGFILDNWFGTKPWLILIFFVGVAAGIMNVVKTAKNAKIKKEIKTWQQTQCTNSMFIELVLK